MSYNDISHFCVMATKDELNNLKSVADLLKEDLSKRINDEKEEILTGLMDLAKGVYIYEDALDEKLKPIKKRKYIKMPDKDVAQYLLNQFIGKPKQNVEVSGDPDRPLTIMFDESFKTRINEVASSTTDDSTGHTPVPDSSGG